MECENTFCIYEKDGNCILEEVSLNVFGACESCIYVPIDREYLETQKQKLLKEYEEER